MLCGAAAHQRGGACYGQGWTSAFHGPGEIQGRLLAHSRGWPACMAASCWFPSAVAGCQQRRQTGRRCRRRGLGAPAAVTSGGNEVMLEAASEDEVRGERPRRLTARQPCGGNAGARLSQQRQEVLSLLARRCPRVLMPPLAEQLLMRTPWPCSVLPCAAGTPLSPLGHPAPRSPEGTREKVETKESKAQHAGSSACCAAEAAVSKNVPLRRMRRRLGGSWRGGGLGGSDSAKSESRCASSGLYYRKIRAGQAEEAEAAQGGTLTTAAGSVSNG